MKLLFVCMGNICRSPAAEGVMRAKLKEAGLDQAVEVDSAGTINLHTGKLPDARMRHAARNRGVDLNHRARQFRPGDLKTFDLILAMDYDNLSDIRLLDGDGRFKDKIRLFGDFFTRNEGADVPDPYYGGGDGFEIVLDMVDDGCSEILRRIQAGTLLQG